MLMTVTSFKKGETRATSGEMIPQLIRFISYRDGYLKKKKKRASRREVSSVSLGLGIL